jgi:hypothetical protein
LDFFSYNRPIFLASGFTFLMEKRVVFGHKTLPYLLLAPQLLITVVFFFLPAGQAM